MRVRALGLTLAGATALIAAACVPQPTPPTTTTTTVPGPCTPEVFSQGEVDAPSVELVEGELEVFVLIPEGDHDHGGEHGHEGGHEHEHEHGEELDPACAILAATDAAQIAVPADPAFSFLGAEGAPVWVLPQNEDPELLYLGYSTEEIAPGTFEGDQLTFSMLDVEGPGDLIIYEVDEFGAPAVLFDSGDPTPQQLDIATGEHVHVNWAFTAAGDYSVDYEFAGTLAGGEAVSSGPVEFTYQVGS